MLLPLAGLLVGVLLGLVLNVNIGFELSRYSAVAILAALLVALLDAALIYAGSALFQRETILIDTSGEKVGQINGLSVISLGNIAFGHPTRITAALSISGSGGGPV